MIMLGVLVAVLCFLQCGCSLCKQLCSKLTFSATSKMILPPTEQVLAKQYHRLRKEKRKEELDAELNSIMLINIEDAEQKGMMTKYIPDYVGIVRR